MKRLIKHHSLITTTMALGFLAGVEKQYNSLTVCPLEIGWGLSRIWAGRKTQMKTNTKVRISSFGQHGKGSRRGKEWNREAGLMGTKGETRETEEGDVGVVESGNRWHDVVVCPGTTMGWHSTPAFSPGRFSCLTHACCHAYILILHPWGPRSHAFSPVFHEFASLLVRKCILLE